MALASFDADGPRYDSPMGVAVDPQGGVVVADTGNRRLIRVAPFDRGSFLRANDIVGLNALASQYRVAVVGSLYTWYFSSTENSIAGFLGRRLTQVPELRGHDPAMRYFLLGRLPAKFELIDKRPSARKHRPRRHAAFADRPALFKSWWGPAAWGVYLRPRLRHSIAALSDAAIPLLIVINPSSESLSPVESANVWERRGANGDYDAYHQAILAIISGLGVPVLDLYPAFRSEIARPDHPALFSTTDHHYSPYGREFLAQCIFAELLRQKLWSAKTWRLPK